MKNQEQRAKSIGQRKGYGPVAAVLVTLGIYFGAQILAGLAVVIYADIRGLDENSISSLIEGSVLGQFLVILLLEALSIYLLWLFLSRRRISWSDIGLKKPRFNNFLYAPLAYGAYLLATIIAVSIIGVLIPQLNLDQEQQIGFETAAGPGLVLVFASLVLLPAIVEEILIRGFLYGGLVKKYSKVVAALIASTIFAAAHLQFGSGQPLLWVAAIDTFILSMVLIWLRERTGNIYAGMLVHMVKNGLAFVGLFLAKNT